MKSNFELFRFRSHLKRLKVLGRSAIQARTGITNLTVQTFSVGRPIPQTKFLSTLPVALLDGCNCG
jgi:hypothetical protein